MIVEILLLLSVVLLYWWKFVHKSKVQEMYSKFPGPKPYPILGNILEFNYPKEEITETFKRLSFQYGPVYLLVVGQEHIVCIRDPKLLETVFNNSNAVIDKAPMYEMLHPIVNQGLFTSKGEQWIKQRRLLTPAFHVKVLENFITIFEKNGAILVENLLKNKDKEFDLMPLVSPCSLDIICETAMGFKVNAQQGDSKYLEALDEVSEIVANRNFNFLQRSFLFPLLPTGRRLRKLLAYFHGVTSNIVQERKIQYSTNGDNSDSEGSPADTGYETKKKKKPFLDLLLEYNMGGAGFTDEDLKMQVNTFMFAGRDTVQSAISFALYCLSQNPSVQEKAYKEVMDILQDDDRDATFQDLQNMKYLDKVIKETLRIYPPAQFVARNASEDLDLKNGYVIPKNSSVMVLIEAMNYDPELYPDPLKFDPERFGRKNFHPFSYIPFGVGLRSCIGQRFAILAIKSVISRVLRKIELFPSDKPLVMGFYVVLRSTTGVHLKVKPRDRLK
ncbi:cytochrome P450 4C1-like [Macrosteles quadrilineatus]|uniref:cytochrome P450 4C1-like n=1 Tax=Macrosteles quadrilineatus TaxID=74068 RepID=UPI0023E32185|nr:cytochrome P450 4C1-like [Macrosteles quadrilineatus]